MSQIECTFGMSQEVRSHTDTLLPSPAMTAHYLQYQPNTKKGSETENRKHFLVW